MSTAYTKDNPILFSLLLDSARAKVKFWQSRGLSLSKAIEAAKRESSAGPKVWACIEKEQK